MGAVTQRLSPIILAQAMEGGNQVIKMNQMKKDLKRPTNVEATSMAEGQQKGRT